MQKLFGANQGTVILPVLLDDSPKNGQRELFASASFDRQAGEAVLKVVNTAPQLREVRINLQGAKTIGKTGKALVLADADLKTENSLDAPTKLAPVEQQFIVSAGESVFTLAPNSLTVLRLPCATR